MFGSEKQIAWAEKIIAQKKEDALEAGISHDEWAKIEEIITRDGGAKAWIDLRNTDPKHLRRVMAISGMPEIEAKSPAQAAYARAERVKSIATVDEWVGLPPHSLDEAEQARRMALHERYVQATIAEMGKETSARKWIDTPTIKMVAEVRSAAIEAAKKQPEEKPAEPSKPAAEKIAARKAEIEAKIAETKSSIGTMAASEMEDLVRRTKYASPERAMELLDEAERKMRKMAPQFFAGSPEPAKKPTTAPVMPTGAKPRMLSAEERAAAEKRSIEAEIRAKREGDELRAKLAKIPLEEQKKRAQQLHKNGVYSRDEYALEMQRIGKEEAAANPAPAPNPEPKLPKGAYIAYQGATIGGEYVIVKDDRGNQASGKSKREAIQNLIAQREKQNFPEAPAKSPAAGAPEPNWATLSAKEIAGKYADEMAQIVISAGETITAGLFEDAGAEFAANAAARNAGDLLRRRATQWTANHAQDIAETLAQAAETSASPHSIVEELAKEYVEHAETVARTELARVREEANLDIMRAQGAEKVQFIASEDERLCPVCGAHHGKVYDVHDAPVLPLHPNCRCTLVPYIGDEEVIMSL